MYNCQATRIRGIQLDWKSFRVQYLYVEKTSLIYFWLFMKTKWKNNRRGRGQMERMSLCGVCSELVFICYMCSNKASIPLSGLLCIFSISNKGSRGTRAERVRLREEKCFVRETIWCTRHSWNLRRLSRRWWIVSSYRQGTVEISNRKKVGVGGV